MLRLPYKSVSDFQLGQLRICKLLDPNVSHSKFPSRVPIASRFPNITASKLQKLDDEWRRLSLVTLPFEHEDMYPEMFLGKLATISDDTGVLQFMSEFFHAISIVSASCQCGR